MPIATLFVVPFIRLLLLNCKKKNQTSISGNRKRSIENPCLPHMANVTKY